MLFLGLSGVTTALLYARRQFTLPAFVVTVYNLGIITTALALGGSLGTTSLVLGIVIGAFLQIALQAPGLRGFQYSFVVDLHHPGVRRIARLYLPVVAGLVVSQLGVLIDRNLASQTGEGSMAAMRFATTLVQFPLGLVGSAVAFAVLPTLSRHAAAPSATGGDAYKATLVRGISMVLMLIVPASVGLAVLREPLVRLLFQHGAFDAEATARTALAFLCYSPSIPFAAVDQLLIFAFYARQNTVTPVLVGVLGVAVYLAVALTLLPRLGMAGLVLANSAQWVVHALILLVLLWRAIGGLRGYGLGWTTAKVLAAGLVMGVAVLAAQPAADAISSGGGLAGLALELAALVGFGLVVFGSLALALRIDEAGWLWELALARLKRRGESK